ncbi:MAG: hypothetical protein AAF371_17370 [Pseudomonadota bacterium]
MISLTDCIEMCGLTEAEVDAIAEHEHLPETAAAALAAWLLANADDGAPKIATMIRDDVRHALRHGNREHAAELLAALRHFMAHHPEARPHHHAGGGG